MVAPKHRDPVDRVSGPMTERLEPDRSTEGTHHGLVCDAAQGQDGSEGWYLELVGEPAVRALPDFRSCWAITRGEALDRVGDSHPLGLAV